MSMRPTKKADLLLLLLLLLLTVTALSLVFPSPIAA
jgi:hypothetical protein